MNLFSCISIYHTPGTPQYTPHIRSGDPKPNLTQLNKAIRLIWLSHVCPFVRSSVRQYANERHVYIYAYVRPAKDLVMGLSAQDQTFALWVDLKEITELFSVAELYPKLSKKFKKVMKKDWETSNY